MRHAAIWHWYLLLCIYIIFFIASVYSFKNNVFFVSVFFSLQKNLVLINRRKDPRYQCPNLMCFFFFFFFGTPTMPNGLILRKLCVKCLCMYVLFYYKSLWNRLTVSLFVILSVCLLLSGRYLLNSSSIFNQTWHGGVLS